MQLDGLEIIQNQSGYKFSTDSVLLANFAKAKQNDVYVDLCSGSGVVAILFSWKNKLKKAYAVELQPQLADMAKRSILHNKLDGVIEVLNQDLSTTHQTLGYESVDVITVNPPYNEVGETSEIDEIAVATHELKTNLSEIVKVSSKLLKFGGKLFMVHKAERLVDIVFECRKNKLEPKSIRVVYPKENKEPNLVLIEASKGGKSGVKIQKPLILNNADGSETQELKSIYNRKSK